MAQMTPEEFARGTQQAFGKAPTQPKPVKSDTPPPSEQWIKRIAEAYPPYREMRTVPVGNPERGQPTTRTYMVSPEIDPFVIGFLTDVLGPMVSIDTADRLHRGDVSGHYGRHGEISDRVRAAYGSKVCVWAPHDELWSLVFQRDDIAIDCYKRPSDADLHKLIFVVGWWTIRTQTWALHGKWRRMNLSNTGETMRGR